MSWISAKAHMTHLSEGAQDGCRCLKVSAGPYLTQDAELFGIGLCKRGGLLQARRPGSPSCCYAGQLLEVYSQPLTHDGHQLTVDLVPVNFQVLHNVQTAQQ